MAYHSSTTGGHFTTLTLHCSHVVLNFDLSTQPYIGFTAHFTCAQATELRDALTAAIADLEAPDVAAPEPREDAQAIQPAPLTTPVDRDAIRAAAEEDPANHRVAHIAEPSEMECIEGYSEHDFNERGICRRCDAEAAPEDLPF